MRTMAYRFVSNDLVIMVHSAKNPTDDEIQAYCDELRTKDVSKVRVLVLTDGGGLNASQRKMLNDVLGGRPQHCAVVSDDSMVRGIVTALSWFNRYIRVFEKAAAEEAFRYLHIPSTEFANVRREARRLRAVVYGEEDATKQRLR